MNVVHRARARATARAKATASPYYLQHSQSAQQFIHCCTDYEFTNSAVQFINRANS